MRFSVDGRPNRINKVAFSNLSGLVNTGLLLFQCVPTKATFSLTDMFAGKLN